ncbi:MAG: PilZ domain-containing protein [Beijerinckiaceae bacterium]|nr:PilZ domain-containing protein [Beijerinckiaceae bacterium]MDO9443178.1 PilZ domain-containing protein [Beijerinckiaceae bacterium]
MAQKEQLATSADGRRHTRVVAILSGRGMLADGTEFDCKTENLSAGGMSILAPVRPAIGQRVVVYLELIGGLEGQVERLTQTGFAMTFHATARKRDKIADQLTWLINRHLLGEEGTRQGERIKPRHVDYRLQVGNRAECDARVIDVSRTGVAVEAPMEPPIGARVTIGSTRGKVARTFPQGFAIEFARPIPLEDFDVDLVL